MKVEPFPPFVSAGTELIKQYFIAVPVINKTAAFNIELLGAAANKSLQQYMLKLQMIVFFQTKVCG